MPPYTFSPATSARTPLVVRSRSPSTYPPPAFRQTFSDSALSQTSPPEDSRAPALPADSPHTAIRIVALLGTEWCCAPVEYLTPQCALPATPPLPPLPFPAQAILLAPPVVSPASHLSVLADVADCFGTSPRRTAHQSTASNAPAPLPASF